MNSMNAMVLDVTAASGDSLSKAFTDGLTLDHSSWLKDAAKVQLVHELKFMSISSAKCLYGMEKFKYYDVVTAFDDEKGSFFAILICNYHDTSKILRREVAHCPIEASRNMVQGLQKDCGLLFNKFNVGDEMRGQQGDTPWNSTFKLYDFKTAIPNTADAPDITTNMHFGSGGTPRGPRTEHPSAKRMRTQEPPASRESTIGASKESAPLDYGS